MSIKLHLVGSDPELVYDRAGQNVAAYAIVGDRDQTRAPIGTDGYSTTGEIRPTACHNVTYHVIKIAEALTRIHNFIQPLGITAYARPYYHDQTMGGHIHVSFWYNAPFTNQMGFKGYVVKEGRLVSISDNRDFDFRRDSFSLSSNPNEFCIEQFLHRMNYLFDPLEQAMWPWQERSGRALTQAVRICRDDTHHRLQSTEADPAYFHLEYRLPSTWLYHPTMARVYLATAKAVMLNWFNFPLILPNTQRDGIFTRPRGIEKPLIYYNKLFNKRYRDVVTRTTPDIRDVPRWIMKIVQPENRGPIDFEAWARFIGEKINK